MALTCARPAGFAHCAVPLAVRGIDANLPGPEDFTPLHIAAVTANTTDMVTALRSHADFSGTMLAS